MSGSEWVLWVVTMALLLGALVRYWPRPGNRR